MDSSNMQCYCGKTFYQLNAFSNHQRHCKYSQERLSSALSKAQEIWAKKREKQRLKRIEGELEGLEDHGRVNNLESVALARMPGPSTVPLPLEPPQLELPELEMDNNNADMVCKP